VSQSAPPSSLPQRVVQFLFRTREEERSARAGADSESVTVERFARSLARAAAGQVGSRRSDQRDDPSSGKVHFLSLKTIRESLGPRWADLRERVVATAESVMTQHLGRGVLHSQVGEDAFVVVLPGVDKVDAQVQCALLLDRIQKRLLGDAFSLRDVTVATYMGHHDGEPVLDARDAASILEGFVRQTVEIAEPVAPCEAEPEVAPAAPEPAPSRAAMRLFPEPVDFVYSPVWDVVHGAVSAYHCTPRHAPYGGPGLFGYQMLPGGENSSFVSELDLRALAEAARELRRQKAAGFKSLVGVELHCRTLENAKTRLEVAAICATLPADLQRLLIIDIVGLFFDAPESRILNCVAAVKAGSGRIALRCAVDDRALSRLQYLGVSALSVDLSRHPMPEQALLPFFNRFCGAAASLNFAAVARGLSSKSQVALAIGAGFDRVEGPAVLAPIREPGPMVRFALEDIYR
jgi:EAL domain-containing protein (putative c-di-GMP-specific phosphodiesterase class I)